MLGHAGRVSTELIAHPFTIRANGTVKTVTDGSSAANAQAIAVIAQTVRGERPMCPGFGVTDPAFRGLDVGEIQAGLAAFGPQGVTVSALSYEPRTETTAAVTIAFVDTEGAPSA